MQVIHQRAQTLRAIVCAVTALLPAALLPASAFVAAAVVAPALAPGFTLERLDGQPLSLSDFQGSPVILLFWTPW